MTLPPDPTYTGQINQYNLQEQNLFGEFGNPFAGAGAPFQERYGYQGGQLLQGLGLTATGEIDVSNPYGRASLLQLSYQQGQRGTTNSMAARGQLYSGAHQRGLGEGTFQYNRGFSGLQGELQRGLHDITQTAIERRFNIDQGRLQAESDRIARAPQPEAPQAAEAPAPAPAPSGPLYPAYPQAQSANDLINIAWHMWQTQARTGGHWRPIIDALGFDPRQAFKN